MPVIQHFDKQGRCRKILAEQAPEAVYNDVRKVLDGELNKRIASPAAAEAKVEAKGPVEQTYAMIKPDVTARGADEVARMLARIKELG